MSDYHVLEGSEDGNRYRIVFHIPVPSVPNRVGVNYRAALVSLTGGVSILPEGNGIGQITTAELALIASGAIYEHVELFNTNPNENAAQIQARLDAYYSELVTKIQTDLSGKLSYYGYTRDVS